MTKNEDHSRLLRGGAKIVGYVLLAMSLLYLADALRRTGLLGGHGPSPAVFVPAGLVAGVAYGCNALFLSVAWWRLVGSGAFAAHHRVIARTQIAKYLPGNVFHFAGRHLASTALGVPQARLISATTGEITSLLAAASVMATAFAVFMPEHAVLAPKLRPALAISWSAVVAAGLALLLARNTRFAAKIPERRVLAHALAAHLLFFAGSGTIVYAIVSWLAPSGVAPSFVGTVGATAAAWLAGFVVPGAPAGVGLREAVLVMLLAPSVGEETVLAAALSFRIATVFGDFVYWLSGYLWTGRDRSCNPANV